jgi:hypothetical protein
MENTGRYIARMMPPITKPLRSIRAGSVMGKNWDCN